MDVRDGFKDGGDDNGNVWLEHHSDSHRLSSLFLVLVVEGSRALVEDSRVLVASSRLVAVLALQLCNLDCWRHCRSSIRFRLRWCNLVEYFRQNVITISTLNSSHATHRIFHNRHCRNSRDCWHR